MSPRPKSGWRIFNYSSESMGTEMCYLFGRANTTLQYDDFTAFDGIDHRLRGGQH
jgi:hypothetical protein